MRPLALVLFLCACAGSETEGPPTAGPGELSYLEPCSEHEQCETELCFNFNAKGPHCTHECTTDGDCEEPSPGCSGMGLCKVP